MQSTAAFDGLVQYLLEEIAMDGVAGTDPARLTGFVAEYYSPSRVAATTSIGPPRQNTDEAFLSYVWKILTQEEEIRVGVVELAAPKVEEENHEETKPTQRKQPAPPPPTHAIRVLDAEETKLGRDILMETYGVDLRMSVTPEVALIGLTGSHINNKSITPMVYHIIQLIARQKADGITTTQIGQVLGIDQKSAFHYIRVGVEAGILKKFRVTFDGCWTNRILHVRYLSLSQEWQDHAEGDADSDAALNSSGGEEDELATQRGVMSTISTTSLLSNHSLIRSRIIRALKAQPDRRLPQKRLMSAIGIDYYSKNDYRRLRSFVNQFAEQGIVQKLPGRTLDTIDVVLVVREADDSKVTSEEEEEDLEDERPHALWNLPIERQIFDLLASADANGLVINDIRAALGGYDHRAILSILGRYESQPPPPQLADFTIHSIIESVGREKRTRFFLLPGFLRRCNRDGMHSLTHDNRIVDREAIGSWSALEGDFYRDAAELELRDRGNMSSHRQDSEVKTPKQPKEKKAGKKASRPEASGRPPPPTSPKKIPKPRISKEEAKFKKGEARWIASGKEGPYVPKVKDPTVVTYYEKKKQEAAERAKQGLPPVPKRDSALGGRRSKAAMLADALAGSGSEAGSASTRPRKRPLRPSRSRKVKPDPSPSTLVGGEAGIAVNSPQGSPSTSAAVLGEMDIDELVESSPPLVPSAAVTSNTASATVVQAEVAEEAASVAETPSARPRKETKKQKEAREKASSKSRLSVKKFGAPPKQPSPPVEVEAQGDRSSEEVLDTAPTEHSTTAAIPSDTEAPAVSVRIAATLGPLASDSTPLRRKTRGSKRTSDDLITPEPSKKRSRRNPEEVPPDIEEPAASGTTEAISEGPIARDREESVLLIEGPHVEQAALEQHSDQPVPLTSSRSIPPKQLPPPQTPTPSTSAPVPSTTSLPNRKPTLADIRSARPSFASLSRQNDLMAYLQHVGGILLMSAKIKFDLKAFLEQRNPESTFYVMDRRVVVRVVNELIDKGMCCRLVTQADGHREVIYLASIAQDSPQMTAFLTNLEPISPTKAPRRKSEKKEKKLLSLEATDDIEDVKAYFLANANVTQARFGLLYGRYARARKLHQFLVEYVETHEVGNTFLPSNEAGIRIISHSAIAMEIPLEILLRVEIVSVPEESIAAFEAFLSDPDNIKLAVKDLPLDISNVIHSRIDRRGPAVAMVQCLRDLGLIKPLVINPESRTDFMTPQKMFATHWEICTVAPLYAFNQLPVVPLVEILPVATSAEVNTYWTKLQDASMFAPTQKQPPIVDPDHSPQYPGPKSTQSNITSSTMWYSQYMLRVVQRKFIARLARTEMELDGDTLQKYAAAILAPADLVRTYFDSVRERDALEELQELPKPRGRKKRKTRRGDESDTEEEDAKLPKSRAKVSLQAALVVKARGAANQKQKDFKAIVERFRRNSGHEAPEAVVAFLYKLFNENRLSTTDLNKELDLLLKDDSAVASETQYQSIIPASVFNAPEPDQYALPRRPIQLPKRRTQKAPAMVAAPHVQPIVPEGGVEEFYSSAIPAAPALAKGQRLPKKYYSPEQDALLLDAAAVIKVRGMVVGKPPLWQPVARLFPGIPADKLRNHFLLVAGKSEEQLFHQRLQDAWYQVYLKKRDEIPDPDPTSMKDFDITHFVRCLRANVDQQALRLSGPSKSVAASVKFRSEIVTLPASLEQLQAEYASESTTGSTHPSNRWDSYWKYAVGQLGRETYIAGTAFSSPFAVEEKPAPDARELALAIAAFKMVTVTPGPSYNEARAESLLRPLQDQLEPAIRILETHGSLTKTARDTRRNPGRGYVLSDKFFSGFEGVVSKRTCRDAENQLIDLAKEEDDVWPLKVESGSMMTLLELVSQDLIDLSIDITPTNELRDPNDYETRKANDQHIECDINYTYTGPPVPPKAARAQLPPIAPAEEATEDPTILNRTLSKMTSRGKKNANVIKSVNEVLVEAGPTGINLSTVSLSSKPASMSPSRFYSDVVQLLLHSSPPLAFWAGDSSTILVSARYLSQWTVLVYPTTTTTAVKNGSPRRSNKGKGKEIVREEQASEDGQNQESGVVDSTEPDRSESVEGVEAEAEVGEGRRVFPLLWIDMTGRILPELWEAALCYVKEELLAHADSTVKQMTTRSLQSGRSLTLHEIMTVLEHLESRGVVQRGAPANWYEEGEEEQRDGEKINVGWDLAKWSLSKELGWIRL